MTERLSDERLDELRTYFSHRVSVACAPACCACDVITALDEVRERRAAEQRERDQRARLAELQREVDDYRAAERPSDWERGL